MELQKFEPAIKWSGSKRSQAWEILKHFPDNVDTYHEPFCGGCSVLMALMLQDRIKVGKYVCGDIDEGLILLWRAIKEKPVEVISHYRRLWTELNRTEDKGEKRKYFEMVRDRFNKTHDPLDFMFIMRTTTNGMPRYNRNGEFNNSFHITRNGINPDRLEVIVNRWSELLRKNDVQFLLQDYTVTLETVEPGDFVYADPPYAGTKCMYVWRWNRP